MKISVSQLKLFKACRRAWFFRYHENLEPVKKADALVTGTNYHALIEKLYDEWLVADDGDYSKEKAMALAYEKYIKPYVPIAKAEEWLEKDLPSGDTLIGRVDGLTADGIVVEHKTTSRDIGGEYEYELLWDEQVLAYMYLTGVRRVIYTVCRKPTIRQKKDETEYEFFHRMWNWYDEDTDKKIRWFEVRRTDAEVEQWAEDFESVAYHLNRASLDKETCYKNTMHCRSFGTACPYQSICLSYKQGQDYVDYVKRSDDNGSEKN